MADDRKASGERPRVVMTKRIVVTDPAGEHADPDEITKVPCPVCRKTLVPPSVAATVNEALRRAAADPASGDSVPPPAPSRPPSRKR